MRRFKAVKGEVIDVIVRAVLNAVGEEVSNELIRSGLAPGGVALVGVVTLTRCGYSTSVNLDSRFLSQGTPALIVVIPLAPAGVVK